MKLTTAKFTAGQTIVGIDDELVVSALVAFFFCDRINSLIRIVGRSYLLGCHMGGGAGRGGGGGGGVKGGGGGQTHMQYRHQLIRSKYTRCLTTQVSYTIGLQL